jgi:hypothetical protein
VNPSSDLGRCAASGFVIEATQRDELMRGDAALLAVLSELLE